MPIVMKIMWCHIAMVTGFSTRSDSEGGKASHMATTYYKQIVTQVLSILHKQISLFTTSMGGRLAELRLQQVAVISRKRLSVFLGQSPALLSLVKKNWSSL